MNKRISVATVFFLMLLAIFFACNRNPPSNTIRAGYLPIADNLQLFVGVEKGFFKEEGVNVELHSIPSGPKVLEAVFSRGSEGIDIGFSSIVPILLAKAQDLPIVIVAGGPVETTQHKTHAILVGTESPIRSGADLAGKTIAVNALKNIEPVMLNRYLEKVGVDPKTINLTEVPFPQMESVLLSKNVDAVSAIEPYVTSALQHGKVRVIDYQYVIVQPRTVVSSYVTSSSWLDNNRDVASRFVRAIQRATDFIRTNEPEARNILMKYSKIDQATANAMVLPEFEAQHSTEDVQKWADQILKQGLINKPLDTSSIYQKLN